MFLRNPWQNITKKEIASLYLSDTSLGDKGHSRILTVTEKKEIDKTSSV